MSTNDRKFLRHHATAYAGTAYARWYMSQWGNADSLADVMDHNYAYLRFIQQVES